MDSQQLFYFEILGKVRDFYIALALAMNGTGIEKELDPKDPGDRQIICAHKRFTDFVEPHRKQHALFFMTCKNECGFLISFICQRIPEFTCPAESVSYIRGLSEEQFLIGLLSFYKGEEKNTMEFFSRLAKDKELMLDYVDTLTLRDDIKAGFLEFIISPERCIRMLCEFLESFLSVFEREYALCNEKLADRINKIKKSSKDEFYSKIDDWWKYNKNRKPDDVVSFTHILFLPKSVLYMKFGSELYAFIGYKRFDKTNPVATEKLCATKLFTPLSDNEKFRIIEHLKGAKKQNVGEIAKAIDKAAPTVSHYLVSMHREGILCMESNGKKNLYFLNTEYIDKVENYLDKLSKLF